MLRQFLTLTAGEGAARVCHGLALFLLARSVGPASFGQFGIVQSIAGYASLLVQRGLDVPATRAVIAAPESAPALRSAVLALRWPVASVLTLAAIVWQDPMLIAACGIWIAAAFQMRWLLVARDRSAAAAVAAVMAAVVLLAGVVAKLPLLWVVLALSVGELAGAFVCWVAARGPMESDAAVNASLRKESWWFLAAIVLGNLMYNLDVFILAAVRPKEDTGLYVAAYRLVTVFSPVLGAMQMSALPAFSHVRASGGNAGALARPVAIKGASLASGAALLLWFSAPLLIAAVYGAAFASSELLLRVLSLALPVQTARMVFRQALLAYGGERADVWNLLIAVTVNGAIDLAFVPSFGAAACAVSTVVAESVYAVLTWRAWRRACA